MYLKGEKLVCHSESKDSHSTYHQRQLINTDYEGNEVQTLLMKNVSKSLTGLQSFKEKIRTSRKKPTSFGALTERIAPLSY